MHWAARESESVYSPDGRGEEDDGEGKAGDADGTQAGYISDQN